MNKWISILAGLLAVQLVLALTLNMARDDYAAFKPQGQLLTFDKQQVDGLQITAGKESIKLKKKDGKWLLPASDNFPASQASVAKLIDKLAAMKKGWPVATTRNAAKHFKVAEDKFERKLTLYSNNKTVAELLVGSSPGFRKVHVRPTGEDAIYAVTLNSWELNAKPDDWIDKSILALKEETVKRIEMADFVLQRKDGKLQIENPGKTEETNQAQVKTLLHKLAGMTIQSLLGQKAKAEYQQEKPALAFKVVLKDGRNLDYHFFKPDKSAYYVLQRSDFKEYFKVADFIVDPFKDITRKKLVQPHKE